MIVITATAFDAYLLGHRDLHMIDVEAIPKWLINGIGEPEINQVLDGFLAEVMVDAEDVAFFEGLLQGAIEFLGALQVFTERFFNDETPADSVALAGETDGGEVLRAGAEIVGGGGEIEEIILADLGAFRKVF